MKTLKELPFSDVLEGRIREDKNLGRPFEAASKYAQSGVPGRLTVHMDILKSLLEKVTAEFGDNRSSLDNRNRRHLNICPHFSISASAMRRS